MAIDQTGAQPLGAQIGTDLRRRIDAGEFPVGSKIPSLRTLAGQYGVAELTVHAAVRELQYAGILESVSGRGTFVRAVPVAGGPSLEQLQTEVADLRERVTALEADRRDG